jgi:hypothetical protein
MSDSKRAGCALLVVLLVGGAIYFFNGTEAGRQLLEQWRQGRQAREKEAVRAKLEAAMTEPVSVPEALAADADGKPAYQTWHRASRLLQEYGKLRDHVSTDAESDEREEYTVAKLAELAASSNEREIRETLNAIRDVLVAERRRVKEDGGKGNKIVGGQPQIDVREMLAPDPKRDAIIKEMSGIQDRADGLMTTLSLHFGAEFPRLPLRTARPLPGSEAEALSGRLVGSWEGDFTHPLARVAGVETYWPDGRFLFTGELTKGSQTSPVTNRGIWWIEGKKLHTRLLHTSGPVAAQPGSADSDEIVALTDDQKTIRDSLGNLETCRKVRK